MSAFKFAAPLGLAVLSVAAVASASLNYITFQNNDPVSVSIDYTVGLATDCDKNAGGRVVIPAKSVEKFKISNERLLCLRITGSGAAWRKEPLAGSKDYTFVVK